MQKQAGVPQADQPARVSAGTKQAGEAQFIQKPDARASVRERWAWVEASIWTDRMLTALEDGVKGGVWFSLIDKVYNPKNLWSAWTKVAQNKGAAGTDNITIQQYQKDVEANLDWLGR